MSFFPLITKLKTTLNWRICRETAVIFRLKFCGPLIFNGWVLTTMINDPLLTDSFFNLGLFKVNPGGQLQPKTKNYLDGLSTLKDFFFSFTF